MIDPQRLEAAYATARAALLAERTAEGHWVGELATSALSTATAVGALAMLAKPHPPGPPLLGGEGGDQIGNVVDSVSGSQPDLPPLRLGEGGRGGEVLPALRWLADHQNADGGWGDTDRSLSNISTTMVVRAAFHLAGAAADHGTLLKRAEAYLDQQCGPGPRNYAAAIRARYGKDRTFSVPILTMNAFAGLVPWDEIPRLPFELACLPQAWYRLVRLPVVSYALPALIALGQCIHHHRPSWNPLRYLARGPSLRVLEAIQPESGGFLEAAPLTSFVMMSLISIGRADHPVVQRGAAFLRGGVRPDGSWPIDSNLSVWVTTLAVNALAGGKEEPNPPGPPSLRGKGGDQTANVVDSAPRLQSDLPPLRLGEGGRGGEVPPLPWLLARQYPTRHPYTGADPGGWSWTHLSGGVPDADDTPGALLALANLLSDAKDHPAAAAGLRWLADLQNGDGGWPTFCRGWGHLPFDRSGPDLTAHALRAFAVWLTRRHGPDFRQAAYGGHIRRGLAYLARTQRPDGSWLPLWFGNQFAPDDENPTYGTARVLAAYRDLDLLNTDQARRGLDWLIWAQNADGSWGGAPGISGSIEETALALEVLVDSGPEAAVARGLAWLIGQVESGGLNRPTPIGFYFAKLWYYERLYPIIFATAALGRARRQRQRFPPPERNRT